VHWKLLPANQVLVFQTMSGGYFVTAAQSVLGNRLLNHLARERPSINAQTAITTGASELRQVFAGDDLVAVIDSYMIGIKGVFAFIVAGTAFSVLLALLVPMERLPAHDDSNQAGDESTYGGKVDPH
jgi:MFS transporter, DHA2 family, glioxin efflux transporter